MRLLTMKRFEKDLKRGRKRGKDLDKLWSVVDISAPGEEDKHPTSYRATPWPDRSCCRSLPRGRSSPSSVDSPRPIGKSRGYC